MSGAPPPLPVNDVAPVIAAGEQQLSDYVAQPTHHILNQLGVPPPPGPGLAAPATTPGGGLSPIDPSSLISPVTSLLGMLGPGLSGLMSGINPAQTSNGIANALGSIAGPVQQAMNGLGQGWLGEAANAAGLKTTAALRNGADLATQATGLGSSLSAAAADVGQAQTRLIAIINEFVDTVAAVGVNIIFPWGWAVVLQAATRAVAEATETIIQLQASLAAHASAVSAIGSAIAVEVAPQLGAAAATVATSLLPVLLEVGTMGVTTTAGMATTGVMSAISPALGAASKGASPAASAATNTGALAGSAAKDSALAAGHAAPPVKSAANGATVGGGGGATVPSAAPVPRLPGPTPPVTSGPSVSTHPAKNTQTRSTTSNIPVGDAGMMPPPLAGAGAGAGAGSSAHTAASFLHTTDHGGKLVGNRDTVPPAVIGEVEPTPDIELRI